MRPLVIERRAALDDDARAMLGPTFGRDGAEIEAGIDAGALQLWRLWGGAAWMVTRTQHNVLTVCCYAGRDVAAMAAAVARQARAQGVREVVFFTASRALPRLLRRAGLKFQPERTVYRCEL